MHCLCLLAGCYLLQVKEVRTAWRLCFFYTILQVLARICAPHTALLYVILHTFARSIPLFFFKDWYLKSLGDSYTEEGKQVLIRFYGSLDMMLLIGLISAALAAVGFWVGMLFFKKHIKKAKLA